MNKFLKKEYWLFIALLILGMGLVAGVFVTQQRQELRQKAAPHCSSAPLVMIDKGDGSGFKWYGTSVQIPYTTKVCYKSDPSGNHYTSRQTRGGLKGAVNVGGTACFTVTQGDPWTTGEIEAYENECSGAPDGTCEQLYYSDSCRNHTDIIPQAVTPTPIPPTSTPIPPTPTPTVPSQGSETYCHQFSASSCPSGLCIITVSCPECRDMTCHYINHAIPTATPTNTPTNTPTPTSGVGGFRPTVTPTRRPTVTPTRGVTSTTTPSSTIALFPSVTPTPFVSSEPPTLIVNPFTNDKKEAPSSFTLIGTSSPNAQITIEISPDGIFGTATANENGQWRYIITQKLTPGAKQLRVTATDIYGITTTYTEDFTVARGGIGARIWTILGLIAAIVVFIIIRRRMNQPPPYTPPSGGPPTPTDEASPFVPSP
ncbi:MAG: Ig-like domain-containing protein [Patescibacteria group bacterium]